MTDFVTVAEAKSYLSNEKADETLLKMLIKSVTAQMKKACGWAIEETQYMEYYPAIKDREYETYKIFFRYAPVTTMIGASFNGANITENVDFMLDYELGIANFIGLANIALMNTVANYIPVVNSETIFFANYQAGFASIPDDLKLAALKQIYMEYNERGGGIKSYSSSTLSYTRPDLIDGFLPEVKAILEEYTLRNFG